MQAITSHVIRLFHERGQGRYGSEQVSQLQHALQAAVIAERHQADANLVAAALLHDIGHIIDDQAMPTHDLENLDDSHEARAYDWLKEHFGVAVADPVRLHVAAKRYLCTVEPEYQSQLSPTSLKSFYDQGGTMSSEEREEFEREVYYHQAVQLRRWDDLAKDPLMPLPAIDTFAPLLDSILEANRRQI